MRRNAGNVLDYHTGGDFYLISYSSDNGPDNGLAPSRRQAIVWTNGGQFTDADMRHSASMS